ncbi:RNA polymerase sigma factor [Larkinella soli]|uniref:RNA polymerase sigma factor n=1 Tax=Larkinella soli TaxID=1770527 RepID=UPI000FFB958F|nr:RNA polymerase sigma-70 factor [Larkinella soli]
MSAPTVEILQKVIQGDQKAFAVLYNHYRKPGLKFCITILKDEEEAENMLHEVFIKLWERRSQINPELNFTSYLFTCLRNLAFDNLKKIEKSQHLRQQYMERMEAAREEELEEQEAKIRLLNTAIDLLSEKRKQILMLNVEEGKSYQEIAEMMHISKNTVKNQLVKAKQFLREKVDFATVATLISLFLLNR